MGKASYRRLLHFIHDLRMTLIDCDREVFVEDTELLWFMIIEGKDPVNTPFASSHFIAAIHEDRFPEANRNMPPQ